MEVVGARLQPVVTAWTTCATACGQLVEGVRHLTAVDAQEGVVELIRRHVPGQRGSGSFGGAGRAGREQFRQLHPYAALVRCGPFGAGGRTEVETSLKESGSLPDSRAAPTA